MDLNLQTGFSLSLSNGRQKATPQNIRNPQRRAEKSGWRKPEAEDQAENQEKVGRGLWFSVLQKIGLLLSQVVYSYQKN